MNFTATSAARANTTWRSARSGRAWWRATWRALGVDPTRMQTISYGKERPAAIGSGEEAWAKNRRAVMVFK